MAHSVKVVASPCWRCPFRCSLRQRELRHSTVGFSGPPTPLFIRDRGASISSAEVFQRNSLQLQAASRSASRRSVEEGAWRTTRAASAGQGFGAKKRTAGGAEQGKKRGKAAPGEPRRGGEGRAVESILKNLEAQATTSAPASAESAPGDAADAAAAAGAASGKSRRSELLGTVDPKIASKGRVDYVRLEGWEPRGSATAQGTDALSEADQEALGNLPVRSFSPGTALLPRSKSSITAEARGGNQAEEETPGGVPAGMPFYEQLVRHLQLLDSKGEMSVARPKGAGPLPPFEKWSFGDERFLQYLVDLHAVHSALELSMAMATQQSQSEALPADERPVAESVLCLFSHSLGIHRATALEQDITSMAGAMISQSANVTAGASKAEALNATYEATQVPNPTTQAAAYGSYITSIARPFQEVRTDTKLPSSPSLPSFQSAKTANAGTSKVRRAELRLLANLFAVYVSNLTTGMRIGAKAMDCCSSMRAARAIRFYRDYPDHVTDPLKAFQNAVNVAGTLLTEEEKEAVLEELPKAVVKTSLLMSVLAVEK